MKISLRKFKQSLLLAMTVCLGACTAPIYEKLDPCESYLEFVFDYNMEFVCSFRTHVETVDVLFFDMEGVYQATHVAHCPTQLISGTRLPLAGLLRDGQYRVLAVGGLTDAFSLTDFDGQPLTAGQTTIDQVQLALIRESDRVGHEFAKLWGCFEPVEVKIDSKAPGITVWQMSMLQYTNRFHIAMTYSIGEPGTKTVTDEFPYTFEIITPEGAVYANLDNSPRMPETVTYTPYTQQVDAGEVTLVGAKINTVRLFDDANLSYRFVVLNAKTGKVVWNYNLVQLLERTKPALAVNMSTQEYFDRESEWNIVIMYYDITSEGALTVFAVKVNNWIIWLNDIEM